jgi:hypothetical protein
MIQFSLELTPEFLKRSYARRIFSGWWKIALAAAAIGLIVIWEVRHGPIGMITVFALSALSLYIIVFSIVWFRQSRALDDWIRQQAGAPVIYSLSDATIETSSGVGSTKLKWEAFRRLSISETDTLLMFSQHGALTLPTGQIPLEALNFLKKQFVTHGKKVEDRRKTG